MTKPSDVIEGMPPDDGEGELSDTGSGTDLSHAQMELLRAAIVQHGMRIAAIDAKLDQQIQDLFAVRYMISKINNRMQRVMDKLGVSDNLNK